MMEIRGLMERELADTLAQAMLVDVPVLPGAAMGPRPDQYVAVVTQDAEQKPKSAYLLKVEIFCVAPVDDDHGIERSKERAAKIERWLQREDCPLIDGSNDDGTLFLHGFSLTGTSRERKERSAAEVLSLRIGASVQYPVELAEPEPEDEEDEEE
jgi:hypothetical protein